MAMVTIIHKNVLCPKWKVQVQLSGKYIFSQEPNEEHIARFMYATCPIVENGCLPLHKQKREYKLMRCAEERQCAALKDFPEKVDVRNGYSV